MSNEVSPIEKLEAYQRLPGLYFCHRLEESDESFHLAVTLLACAGYKSAWLKTDGGRLLEIRPRRVEPTVYRVSIMCAGDVITFRRTHDHTQPWSMITYRKTDFDSRYRGMRMAKVKPSKLPLIDGYIG